MSDQPKVIINFPGLPPGGWQFRRPVSIVRTNVLDEVRDSLNTVASAVRDGLYAVGWLSYEAAPAFDCALRVRSSASLPLLWFGLYESPEVNNAPPESGEFAFSEWLPEISREQYNRSFNYIHEAIGRGDTYQVNQTFRLRSTFTGNMHSCYSQLLNAHPAAYAAYINIGDYSVLSLSPELLFEVDGLRARTRPMKGTMRRGRWLEEDIERERALASSLKDRAENVMIVDLMRNDFGKVAQVGTVTTPMLF